MDPRRTWLSTGALGMAVVLFLAVNMLSNAAFHGARLDLTEGRIYSLSEGSRSIAASLDEPVALRLYFSRDLAADIPTIRAYAERVEGLLREYETAAGGKLRLEVLEPEPFSELEDQAVQAGLQAVLLDSDAALYFGLVATGSTDERSVIPFLDPSREGSLEYEISRLIHQLGRPVRPVLAVVSGVPMQGQPSMPFPGAPPGRDPWVLHEQLQEAFDVRNVSPGETSLPEDADLLLVVHPKDVPDVLVYAIDQFVLAGGRALVFVDPHCEREEIPHDPGNPLAAMMAPRGSNLERLFRAWGLEMPPDKLLADRRLALRARTGDPQPELVDYVLWLGLGREQLDAQDLVTSNLGPMRVATCGILEPLAGATTTITPLIRSTDDAMTVDTSRVQFRPEPKRLLAEFAPSGRRYTIAARVTGPVESAFPDGPPEGHPDARPADDAADDDPADDDAIHDAAPGEDQPPSGTGLARSEGPIQAIVVADVDMLADAFWVDVRNLFGTRLAIPTASNGDFVIHALDNLSGSNDLISLRTRASFDRPFDRIEAMRKDAEQRYLAREQALQEELAATERRLTELQSEKEDAGSQILSPEQRAEIERFREEQVATRKELRAVQHELRKDIDRFQLWIKVVNIGLVPLLVGLTAAGVASWRTRRQAGSRP
jgi:ABC-type uncharacterized transport system involved in gliding motility auxiliary subunit